MVNSKEQETERNNNTTDDAKQKIQSVTRASGILHAVYKHRGISIVILACLLSALHSVFVRYVKEELHPMQVSFTRFVLQLVFPIPLMIYHKVPLLPETRTVGLMLLTRGLFGMVALTLFFYSLYFTRVGDATAIFFGSPVFACIFARLFLKEAIGIVEIILVFVVIGGVFMIAQPPFLFGGGGGEDSEEDITSEFIGAMLALFACICLALTTVLMRKMGTMNINSTKIVFYYASVAAVGTGILTTVLGAWTMPSCGKVRLALVGMGVMNSASQCLITYSLSIEKVVFVTTLRTNEVVFAFILEFLLFSISPEVFSLIGAAMVITASFILAIKKLYTEKRNRSKQKHIGSAADQKTAEEQEILRVETRV